jgi:DNA-binding response OmpR family regulator
MNKTTPQARPLVALLDDDPVFTGVVATFLQQTGYRTGVYSDVPAFFAAVAEGLPDLVLIDLELNDRNHTGLQVIERLRQEQPARLSILVLTNHDRDEYYLQANRSRVDGFLEKRRDLKVLESFIDSILRRNAPEYLPADDSQSGPGTWQLDSFQWILRWQAPGVCQETRLTEKEFLVLEWLNRKHGRVVRRAPLVQFCNQFAATPLNSERSVDSIIRHLREKFHRLNAGQGGQAIESVYGGGYRLLLPLKVC